jgi:hypothetical protein
MGYRFERIWHTNMDDLVCGICEPLAEKVTDHECPAHVNCRCWTTHRVVL